VIGGPDAGTPGVCDGACNLFADTIGHNLRFDGDPVNETAGQTTVAGNFVGLDLAGADQGATLDVIHVGDAPNITIGGPAAAHRNYIGGGADDGIDARAGATNLDVLNNFIGLAPDGHTAVPATDRAVAVAADGAEVRDNRFAGTSANKPAFAVDVAANSAQITGNVFGVGTGGENVGIRPGGAAIRIIGNGSTVGGAVPEAANTIGFSTIGVAIAGNSNQVLGNYIGTDASGTKLSGAGIDAPLNGVIFVSAGSDNVVGGPTAARQNVISNHTAEAISAPFTQTRLTIGRNLGTGNVDAASVTPVTLFADVGTDGLGLGGSNGDISRPQVAGGATSEGFSGTAPPGANVLLYTTPEESPTAPLNLSSFAAEVTADGAGNWSVACPSPACPTELHGPGQLTGNATDAAGNSSEFEVGVPYSALAPETAIDSGPAEGATLGVSSATFGFSASEAGSTFECRIDGAAFAACSGPGAEHTAAGLAEGPHTFEVRAIDAAANADPTPATRSFTVDAVPPDTPPATPDTNPPETTIDKRPKDKLKVKKAAKVTYEFSSDEPGSAFRCRIDGKAEAPCASPLKLSKLKKGSHSIEVVAIDTAGNRDPSPATDSFRVKRKRKRR
jgi:hypothetical protein